jgi:hypothetical protein
MRPFVQIMAAGAVIVLAGCGASTSPGQATASSPARASDPRTAAAIITQLKTAIRAARSVHVTGDVIESGSTGDLNVSLTKSGQLSGSVTKAGTQVKIIDSGHTVYIQLSKAFLQAANVPVRSCAKLCG